MFKENIPKYYPHVEANDFKPRKRSKERKVDYYSCTVAAKSIRTPAVSPSDSSVKDPFLPSHNSAKKRFQELKKN